MEPAKLPSLSIIQIPEKVDPFPFLPKDLAKHVLSFADEISRKHTLSLVCKSFKQLFPPSRGNLFTEEAVMQTKSINLLDFLNQKLKMPLNESLCLFAAKQNQQNMLEWLRSKNVSWDESTCLTAAYHGHLELLKWLRSQECPWNYLLPTMAAQMGHLKVIQWARENGCTVEYDKVLGNAAEFGHLHVVEWSFLRCATLWNGATNHAAKGGHLHIVKWLRNKGFPWENSAAFLAAKYGHLPVLKFVLADGAPYNLPKLIEAAEGHPQILNWLQNEFVPGSERS